ncbi:MAG: hypothetical protein IJT30_00785 [Muribaculaceae bacterium]|nr:hypothetical protein [Muribaculaceae bacterium]
MKGFLKLLALFSIPLLVALIAGEAIVRQYPNSYRAKDEWLRKHRQETETLVLGNSHTYYSVNPSLLRTRTFSVANVSQTLEYDWKLLEHYFGDDSCHLRNVIVQLDFGNLFDYPLEESPWDWERVIYYRLYMGLDGQEPLNLSNRCELSCLASFKRKLTPALSYLLTGEYSIDCDSLGFGITTTRVHNPAVMNQALEKAMHRFATIDYSQSAYNEQYLYRIAEFCQSRGIRMIIIATPLWREFALRKSRTGDPALRQAAETCVEQYGACYHDYSTDARIVDEDFVDGEHMSPLGAEHFSRILTDDYGL